MTKDTPQSNHPAAQREDPPRRDVQRATGNLIGAIGDALSDSADRAKQAVSESTEAQRTGVAGAAHRLRDRIDQTADSLSRKATEVVTQTVDAVADAVSDAADAVRSPHQDSTQGSTPQARIARTSFTAAEARDVGEQIGIDWAVAPFNVEQFRMGMGVELEHGFQDAMTNVTNDDPVFTGKIALAHLNEFADYYTRLERMEEAAKEEAKAKAVAHSAPEAPAASAEPAI